jgi:hypothetical protein
VYAGADGNVYQHNADGWSKYDNGSWGPVTKPTNPNATGAADPRTPGAAGPGAAGATGPNAGDRRSALGQSESGAGTRQSWANSANGQQLDRDRFARNEGAQRFQQFGQFRQGGGRPFTGFAGGGFRGRR